MTSSDAPLALQDLLAKMPDEARLEIPPKVFTEMQAEFVAYERNRMLRVRMPALAWYANPAGTVQGGIIAAAFDNAFGPFSYLIAKAPCVTKSMTINYIRPVIAGNDTITVEAILLARTSTDIILEGKAYNQAGKLAASASSTLTILKPTQLPRVNHKLNEP